MPYETVIGLEVHVQVRTRTKMFCACPNHFGDEPNSNVCPVCLGYPGVLPVPNAEAVRKTIAAGLMLGCKINEFSKFDRKNYYYPDMPKNYQITQFDLPFCLGGAVPLAGKGYSGEPLPDKRIGITRIHLEEDVGKLNHFGKVSGVDFNRAGVPLMEIVSEPDMRSADEAYAYLTALKQVMQYAGISDCDMEKGQLRCDVNISVRPFVQKEFGTKIELKNLNSFRAVHRSILHEITRQTAAVSSGEKLRQETRGWNDPAGETYLMRTKENAHDYRYFPEPDMMPVEHTPEQIAVIRYTLPEVPWVRRERFVTEYGITPYDAHVLTLERELADYYETAAKASDNPKQVANWVTNDLLRLLGERDLGIGACPVKPADLAALAALTTAGKITGNVARAKVFPAMLETGKTPDVLVKELGLEQVNDDGAIEGFVTQAVAANPKAVEEYRAGKAASLQFLVGQVMKLSRGKANPQGVISLLKQHLD